ncbi:MAG: phosphatidylglycerophosphatase A [Pseudomonadota bacterium]
MIAHLIGTVGFVGHMKPAPGTWGSLAALPLAWILTLIHPFLICLAIPVVFAVGVWATGQMAQGAADPDKSEIVIDEVIGQWIALLPVVLGAHFTGAALLDLYPGWIAAFVLFRLFDIWKPDPIGRADARKDAIGVMLDDVYAGIAAAVSVCIVAGVVHWVVA